MTENYDYQKIAVLGGTGKEGKGLAYQWAKAHYPVIIGSRDATRATATAVEIKDMLSGEANIQGMSNEQAAQECQVAVITVPYSSHRATLEGLKDQLNGKLLIDVTVPLVPPKVSKVQMPVAGSAAQEACQILGESVQVVAAFQNISYENLMNDTQVCDCDVLVTGTGKDARQTALVLVRAAGFIGWDAGPIENSVVVEGLTSVLIGINQKYGSTHAGIRITGITRNG